MRDYLNLLRHIFPFWRRMTIAIISMIMVAALTAISTLLVKNITDDIFINKNVKMLQLLPVAILALYLAKGIFSFLESYQMAYIGQKFMMAIRSKLYEHLQCLSLSYFLKTQSGQIISRLTYDINLMQSGVSSALKDFVSESLIAISLAFVVFYRHYKLALIAFIAMPIAILIIIKFGSKIRKISKRAQAKMGDLTAIIQENLSGVWVVKSFCQEKKECNKFENENMKFFNLNMKAQKIDAISSPSMEFIASIGIAFIIWYGGREVINGVTTPGTFFSFMTALLLMYNPIKRISKVYNIIQQSVAASTRISEILETKPDVREKLNPVTLTPMKQYVEFKNVSFKYEDEWVLKDINFKVDAGELVAFVGLSGAGKSTIVNLIPRFYDPVEGGILIDGIDIREVTLKSLRDNIGIVTQETFLFNDTIRNNIAYGKPDCFEEEVIEAARAAYSHNFITAFPDGYDTIIGERGLKISGGERQRISIARAILKNPAILILDEATSSLDAESEIIVQAALRNLMKNRTTFVIAHRLSTIKGADRIIVIDQGKVAEIGRHDELLSRCGIYSRLYEIQFKEQIQMEL